MSSFHGQPWERAHCKISKCPFLAALAHVAIFQLQTFSWANFRTSKWPPSAANEQGSMPFESRCSQSRSYAGDVRLIGPKYFLPAEFLPIYFSAIHIQRDSSPPGVNVFSMDSSGGQPNVLTKVNITNTMNQLVNGAAPLLFLLYRVPLRWSASDTLSRNQRELIRDREMARQCMAAIISRAKFRST
jgi:hypothetical protein